MINTIETIREIVSDAKNESLHTSIALSSLTIRKAQEGISNKIDAFNKSLRKLAKEEKILIVENSNIDTASLSPHKLHLNRKVVYKFACNFIHFLDVV